MPATRSLPKRFKRPKVANAKAHLSVTAPFHKMYIRAGTRCIPAALCIDRTPRVDAVRLVSENGRKKVARAERMCVRYVESRGRYRESLCDAIVGVFGPLGPLECSSQCLAIVKEGKGMSFSRGTLVCLAYCKICFTNEGTRNMGVIGYFCCVRNSCERLGNESKTTLSYSKTKQWRELA